MMDSLTNALPKNAPHASAELKHVGGSVGPEYEALKREEYERRLKEDIEKATASKKKVVLHVHHKAGTRDWINSRFFGRREGDIEGGGSGGSAGESSGSSSGAASNSNSNSNSNSHNH